MAKNNLLKLNLKGKVKSIKETNHYTTGSKSCMLYIFDIKGNKIEANGCDLDSKVTEKNIYKYDSKGNQIESVLYYPDGSILFKFVYKYDSKGNQIEETILERDGSINQKYTFKYDSKGNKLGGFNYDKDGKLLCEYTYKYDSDGYIICEKWIGSEYSCSKRKSNVYNKKGNCTKRYFYDEDDSLFSVSTFKYDSKGNIVEHNIYTQDDILELISYTKYDKNGNIIEGTIYYPDGILSSITTFKYKYDKMGNWVQKKEFAKDKLRVKYKREFEYYSDLSIGILHDDNLN